MKTKLPPGPRLPALAQLVRMSIDPYGWLAQCRDRYGDLFTLKLPGGAAQVFVADPDGVKQLTTGGYEDFARDGEAIRFLLGDHAVIFQQDAPHKATRKLMMPPFHGERMRAYGHDMARITDEIVDGWRDGASIVLHKEMQRVTLGVILRSVFGISDGARFDELGRLIVEHLDAVMTPWVYSASLIVSGARVRDFMRRRGGRVAAIDAILFDEIARCRALDADARQKRQDILALLIDARYDDGTQLGDEELRDHLMTLLVGGHETTATSLSWAIACALGRPGTLGRMRAEVDDVFAGGFDPARVKELAFVGAVANESMRLYPIATAVTRVLKREHVIAGWTLPAGTRVSPCIYLLQRDARVWPEPDAFKPERFLDGKPSVYQFFPFGAGVWRCLGAQFADYEMRVVLARLVARVDMELQPGVAVKPAQRGFTVAPSDGVPLVVKRRQQQPGLSSLGSQQADASVVAR